MPQRPPRRRPAGIPLALGVAFVGCSAGSAKPSPDVQPARHTDSGADFALSGTPSAWDPALEAAETAAPLSPADVADGLEALIRHLHALDPKIHHDAYTHMFWTHADPDNGCPELSEHNGMDLWRADCTTWLGARFNGFNLNVRAGGWSDGPLSVITYDWVTGHGFITSPDGIYFQSFGDVDLRVADHDAGYRVWDGFVFGDFVWADPSVAGTWVQQPTSHEVYFAYEQHATHRTATLSGGLTQLEGPVLAALFDGLSLSTAAGGCAAEPTGRLDIRDAAGNWYALELDDGLCDGCVHYTLDGADLGEVCADWKPLTNWEGWPWERG